MKIVHLLVGGGIGGIETLCKDYALYSKNQNIMLILWGDGPISEEMRKAGINVISLHASKRNVLATVKKVAEVCEKEKADAIVAHHAAPMSHLCLLYAKKKLSHIRTIAYAHGNAVDMARTKDKRGLWLRKTILRTSLKSADRVIAISESVKRSLTEYFNTPKDKIAVVYNGVDLSRFNIPRKENHGDVLRLIYVGRLIKEKGVQLILKGLREIEHKEKYSLKIVGDGPYRSELEGMSREFGLSDYVEFCGSRRDIPELLAGADVFVHMPVWEEGFGITIIEAMAEGLICVCARSGAIPEIITDGKDGFLVDMGSPEQLAAALEKISGLSENERDRIQTNAQNRSQSFSAGAFARQLDEVIEKVLVKNDSEYI